MPATHTSGPWTVSETHTGALSINKAPRVPVATVGGAGWHLGEETARANARLIAAAPDLLAEAERDAAFLEQLAAHLEANGMPGQAGNCTIRAKATRAAIAKARGGEG